MTAGMKHRLGFCWCGTAHVTNRSPYRFVRIPSLGSVDLNKFRITCQECGHEVTGKDDLCEHMAGGGLV